MQQFTYAVHPIDMDVYLVFHASVRATTRHQQQQLQAQVYDEYVIPGNTAVLKCHIPAFFKDNLEVVSWIREDNTIIKQTKPSNNARMTFNGNLHISNIVGSSDLELGYWCQVKNKLTNDTFLSKTAGKIRLTEPRGGVPPTITDLTEHISVNLGQVVKLECAGQGNPPPKYRWISGKGAILSSSAVFTWTKTETPGTYSFTCIIENRFGSDSSQVKVIVKEKLDAYITPSIYVANSGEHFNLTCNVKGHPVENVFWMFNGEKVVNNNFMRASEKILYLNSSRSQNEGMYQCFVSNKWDNSQSAAQVILGDVAPTFTKTFKSKKIQPGPSISLECSALGRPIPEITWILNGRVINSNDRFLIEEKFMEERIVTSKLTVKSIRVQDGGEYSCVASNDINKKITHSDSISIYGLPIVQQVHTVNIAAGIDVTLRCYVSGYPIHSIEWEKGRNYLPENTLDYQNGTLLIQNVKDGIDEGKYVCTATNGRGQTAKNETYLNVLVKPSILKSTSNQITAAVGSPFSTFCSVVAGDEPINIYWHKNYKTIILGQGTDISTTKMYSVLQLREVKIEDAGNYTCIAENLVGKANQTIELKISYSPKWIKEPINRHARINEKVSFDCIADAFPKPKIKWRKIVGKKLSKLKDKSRYMVYQNGTFEVKSVDDSVTGKYTCIVANGINPNLHSEVRLQIKNLPKLEKITDPFSATIGSAINVECKMSGDQPITILWQLNDKMISSNSMRSITTASDHRVTTSVISFANISVSDKGTYKCIGRNKHGKFSANVKVETENQTMSDTKQKDLERIITKSKKTVNKKKLKKKEKNILPKTSESILGTSNSQLNMIILIVPAASVIVLLIAVIITIVIYILTKKKNSNSQAVRRASTLDRDSRQGTLNYKKSVASETLDRRYGRLDRPLPVPNYDNMTLQSNKYEIPDYCSIHTQEEISITGPIFITEPRARVEFLNTEGVRLDCLAHGEPIPSIKWYRLDAENEKEIGNLEPILKILNNGSLVLESFTPENFNHEVHSAVYKCRAENEHGSISSVPVSVRATIKQQQQQLQAQVHDGYVIEGNVDHLKVFITPSSQVVDSGEEFELLCKVSGHPVGIITWTLNGMTLEIKNIRTEEGGQYTCSAQNSVGNISHSSNINVYGLPKVHKMKNFTVVADGKISLRCFVSGFPIKDIQWERARKNRYLPRNSVDYGNGTLVINKAVDRKDEGEYSCFASNGQGQGDKQSTFLEILRKPVIDKHWAYVSTADIHGQFSKMCSVESGDVPIEVFWLKNDRPMVLGHGADIATTKMYSVLQIRDIKDIHRGNYTCVAKNIVGQDSKTVELRVSVRPKLLFANESVLLTEKDNVRIYCEAWSNSDLTMSWKFKGNIIKTKKFREMDIAKTGINYGLSYHIQEITEEKAGQYTCLSTNIYGESKKEVAVIFKSYYNTPQQVTNNYLMPTTYHTPAQFEKTTILKFTTLKTENGQSDESKNLNDMQKTFEDADMDEGNLDESEVPDTLPSTNSQGLSVNLNMIIFIVPAVVVILLLLALIMTLTAYLLIKKKNSQQKQLRQTLSEDRNSKYGGSLNYKTRSSAGSIDRRSLRDADMQAKLSSREKMAEYVAIALA
ncbi:Down syndrome cell adhesion molecule-like protein Dscam2 [Nymphon striatum]|nr:Down syndrome cell adhesion molecule-like protein Dscam2 [Nymphon striatum]